MPAYTCKTNKKTAVVHPAASPMPKSDQGIWRVKELVFFNQVCHTFFGVIPSSFMEEGGGPLSWEVDDFLPKRKGKVAHSSHVMTCSSL